MANTRKTNKWKNAYENFRLSVQGPLIRVEFYADENIVRRDRFTIFIMRYAVSRTHFQNTFFLFVSWTFGNSIIHEHTIQKTFNAIKLNMASSQTKDAVTFTTARQNFVGDTVISIRIHAIRSFAWEWKISPNRFLSCSSWSWKFDALTTRMFGLTVTYGLHNLLNYWKCTFLLPMKYHWNVVDVRFKLPDMQLPSSIGTSEQEYGQ